MKITRKQLRRLIREEAQRFEKRNQKLLKEQWGDSVETGSDLIDFAKAYSSLGNAVQQQVEALCNAWFLQGAHEPDWSEAVYEQNANAIDIAERKLSPGLRYLAREGVEEAESMLGMFEEAQKVYEQGEAEVEADARAAGDR